MTRVQPMATRPGWNYETPRALFQLWPPNPGRKTEPRTWCAAWTELRARPDNYYLDDEDDGWRPACDFGRGATPEEAMQCFPHNIAGNRARHDLLQAAQQAKLP